LKVDRPSNGAVLTCVADSGDHTLMLSGAMTGTGKTLSKQGGYDS
jgi:hypothetical protein